MVNVYYYIAADTIEEDIVDILERKRAVIKELMDGDASHRWAAEMERIQAMEDEIERDAAYEDLQREMHQSTKGNNISMAAEFLSRMKDKLHIHS